jgi:hypothetical protein
VVELNARCCTPRRWRAINHHAADPKVHITINTREVLLTTPQRYDVIFSRPSNPFLPAWRACSRASSPGGRRRLRPGGIFLQWLQAYEVDAQTVPDAAPIGACSVGRGVQTISGDLLLLVLTWPHHHDVRCPRGSPSRSTAKRWRRLAPKASRAFAL